jgi:hypothetical protein
MRITKTTLRKIIREELDAAMNEIGPSTRTLDDMGEGELNAKLDGLERALKDAESKSDYARMKRLEAAIEQVKAKLPHGGGSGPTGRAAMDEAAMSGDLNPEFRANLQKSLAKQALVKAFRVLFKLNDENARDALNFIAAKHEDKYDEAITSLTGASPRDPREVARQLMPLYQARFDQFSQADLRKRHGRGRKVRH